MRILVALSLLFSLACVSDCSPVPQSSSTSCSLQTIANLEFVLSSNRQSRNQSLQAAEQSLASSTEAERTANRNLIYCQYAANQRSAVQRLIGRCYPSAARAKIREIDAELTAAGISCQVNNSS